MAAIDPSAALIYALQCPTDSPEQSQALKGLRVLLESDIEALRTLCPTLLQTAMNMQDSIFKRWAIDLFHFSITTNCLSLEIRTQLALQCADTCASLLAMSTSMQLLKRVIQCYAQLYPLLFRFLCINRANRQPWDVLSIAKRRIIEFIENTSAPGQAGVRLAALKFAQRVILVQTRGVSDPRLQNKADPNVSLVPTDHPFINATALETEGTQLLTLVTTILYSSSDSDSVSAIINSFGTLAKARPQLLQFIIEATSKWSPAKLTGQSAIKIRSAEKSIFILLNYLLKSGVGQAFTMDIARALEQISERIKQIIRAEHARRAAATEAERERTKRAASTPLAPVDPKRLKLDPNLPSAVAALASFNFQDLPADLVTDLIIANLQHFSVQDINAAIDNHRTMKAESGHVAVASKSDAQQPPQKSDIDDEEMEYEPDKLNRELDLAEASQEAQEIEDTTEADELALQLQSTTFELPPPQELEEAQAESFIRSTMSRISRTGTKQLERAHLNLIAVPHDADSAPMPELGTNGHELLKPIPPYEMWISLFVRVVTRGQRNSVSALATQSSLITLEQGAIKEEYNNAVDKNGPASSAGERNDDLRQMICNYIMEDFSSRSRIATIWLNEEWYNDDVRGIRDSGRSTYDFWLLHLLELYLPHIEGTDRALTKFLLDLPSLPQPVLQYLAELAIDPSTAAPGFNSLRELVVLRPPMRGDALNILLQLTTHSDTKTRVAAINTVKKWVPDVKPMDVLVQKFATRLLRRLETRIVLTGASKPVANGTTVSNASPEVQTEKGTHSHSLLLEDGETPDPELNERVTTPYLPGELSVPADPGQVLQHVQLLFALSVKVPDLLDEIFLAYNKMEDSVQDAIQDLLTPLIRSLGSSHGKLLTLLRTFSPGAESLALRVLKILTEHGRPSAPLVALVKGLISERDLDARFLVPIVAELDRSEIERQLPRIMNLLSGRPEERDLVRTVFLAIVEPPSQGFGTSSTNLPRVRESELLKPVELLMFLHETDKGVKTKCAMEGIDICFGLTELFPSEVFAVGMQQIVDKPTLPVLFMRTVIQAVRTYKSLIPFVARTLMSRLILKKIWTVSQLWDGFMICAKLIAPASYGALQQLPREQLAEVAEKHPVLRSGLRDHIIKKGGAKSKILEVLGGDENSVPAATAIPTNVVAVQVASPSA